MSDKIQCGARVEGSFNGKPFVWVEQIDDRHKGLYSYYPGQDMDEEYWWTDGNMACDCNRVKMLPPDLKAEYIAQYGEDSHENEIIIYKVIPIGHPELPVIYPNRYNEEPL